MNRYFIFDCETGGIPEQDASLLTIYGEILDHNLNVLDSIDLAVKPDDSVYKVHPNALECNKINLTEHDRRAIKYNNAKEQFTKFIIKNTRYFPNSNNDHEPRPTKLIPVGHQVQFDIDFIKGLFDKELYGNSFDNVFTRYAIDTKSLSVFLQLAKKLPKTLNPNLENLAKTFNMSYDGAHNAEFDTKLTLAVLKELLKTII